MFWRPKRKSAFNNHLYLCRREVDKNFSPVIFQKTNDMSNIIKKWFANEDSEQDQIRKGLHIRKCPYCNASKSKFHLEHFRSPQWTWEHLCGREGYTVICNECKKEIDTIITIMN